MKTQKLFSEKVIITSQYYVNCYPMKRKLHCVQLIQCSYRILINMDFTRLRLIRSFVYEKQNT